MRISDWSSDVCSSDLGTISRALGFGVKVKDGEEDTPRKCQYQFSPYTADELGLTDDQRLRLGKFHPFLIMWDEGHQIPYENQDSMAVKILNHFYDCRPSMRQIGRAHV